MTTITVTRNMRGELEAVSDINLSAPGRILRISTSKGSNGMIVSRAQCGILYRMSGVGMVGFKMALGLGGGGDFSKRIINEKGRATEKAIAAQHHKALAGEHGLLAEAEAYYAANPKGGPTTLGDDIDARDGIAVN